MRVGSKVVYIGGRLVSEPFVVGKIYTVSAIDKCIVTGDKCITVEEIDLGVCGSEPIGEDARYFREIDTRPELSELTDEIILTAPEELQTA